MTSDIKLTPKQKEVILAMRSTKNVLRWIGKPLFKYIFQSKTLRHDVVHHLQMKGMIEAGEKNGIENKFFQLTRAGKKIIIK